MITLDPDHRRLRWLRFLMVAIPVVYVLYFLCILNRVGRRDYDQFLVFHELQYWNASLFGSAKQWSPVMGSGISLAAEPQVPFFSLSMALAYLFGPLGGLQIAIPLYFLTGWTGAFLYAGLWTRQLGVRCLAASLFIGNGFFVCRLTYGHVDFIPFLVLPLVLWMLHRSCDWSGAARGAQRIAALTLVGLLLGAGFALVIDGSPAVIVYLMFWIFLYGAVLAHANRSFAPIILLGLAAGSASLLDAGYLWPMLSGQADAPRLTEDRFSNPLAILWFAVVPMRGKVMIPANGKGYEFSVFIGPIIAYCIWKYRKALIADLPSALKTPLAVVAVASIVLAMGSLKPLHIPVWFSPFDWLRLLPGFRSINVTGRFDGFLALPLALFGAVALWKFCSESGRSRGVTAMLASLVIFQFGYQIQPMYQLWVDSRKHQAPVVADVFTNGPQPVDYVFRKDHLQGEFITPTQGVIDCYDEDDIPHADMHEGTVLIRTARVAGQEYSQQIQAGFLTWNRIRVDLQPSAASAIPDPRSKDDAVEIVFNQAYHRHWHADGGAVLGSDSHNLVLRCALSRLRLGPIELVFHDPVSALGADVSKRAWLAWLAVVLLVGTYWVRDSKKTLPSDLPGTSPR